LYSFDIGDKYTYFFLLDVIYDGCEYNGIDIAKRLRNQHKDCYIAFASGHIELMYMVVNENLMISGFIGKPVEERDVEKLLSNVFDYALGQVREDIGIITINTGSAVHRLQHKDIVYVEAYNKKILIYTVKNRISCYNSLAGLEAELGSGFMRCHKSFLVNKARIVGMKSAEMLLIMDNEANIPISRTYKSEVKSYLNGQVN
jgi:DNA-binding LytR/AlgR family response regulator